MDVARFTRNDAFAIKRDEASIICRKANIIQKGAVAECKSSAAALFLPRKGHMHQECGKLLEFHEIWV